MKLKEKNSLQISGINLQLSKEKGLKRLRDKSGIKEYKIAEKLDVTRVKLNNVEKESVN